MNNNNIDIYEDDFNEGFEDIEQLLKPQCEFKASDTLKEEVIEKAREEIAARRSVKMWPWAAAACVAGVLIMFLMPPRIEDSALTSQADKVKEVTQTDSPSQQVTTRTVEPQTATPTIIEEHDSATKTVNPARTELIAEATPATNAHLASDNESATDSNQIQLPPILHPERLAYTPEEVEALKQRAKEKYLEWIQLEREIMELEENNTASNIE